jgi:tetratricopeptide (TPR) repeat protein
LEALRGADAEPIAAELAHHWESAGEPRRAVRHHLRVAERALTLFAHEEARERVERAVAYAEEPRTVARALLLREELARRAGDREAQQRDLAALEGNAVLGTDDELRCEILRRRAALAHVAGDRAAEESAIAALLAAAARIGSARWETTALVLRATADVAAGRFDEAQAALERARSLAPDAEPALAVEIACTLAHVAVHRAQYDEAERLLDEAWIAAGNDEALRYRVLDQRNSIARARERFDRVHLLARDLLAYSQRIGDRRAEMANHLRLANAALFVFGIEEAREHYAIAERMAQRLGSPRDRTTIALCRGIFAYALGIVDAGRDHFEAARAIAASDGDAFGTILADVNLAAAYYAAGAFEEAVEGARACIEPAHALGAVELEAAAYCTAGAALRRLGRSREAVASLERGVAMERAAGLRWTIGQDVAELTLAQLDAGLVEAAVAAVDELQTLAETSFGGLTQPQFMLHVAARAARALGDVARAEELFARAESVYRERLAHIPDAPTRASFARAWFNDGLVAVDAF